MCTPPRAPRHADDRGVWRYVIRRCAQALELKLADACGAVALVELGPTPASARRACAFSGGAQQPLQLSGHSGTRRLGRAATAAQVTATNTGFDDDGWGDEWDFDDLEKPSRDQIDPDVAKAYKVGIDIDSK